MNRNLTVAVSMIAGAALGAAAIQALHAQVKPHAFVIAEVDVTNQDAYVKEFVPLITKTFADNGAKFLARGGKTLSIEGDPPRKRVVVNEFESMDKVQAWIDSAAYKEAFAIGKKYATFRNFAVEGIAQ
jgi:uncharacterized protein (DUF1330 family)